MGSDEEIILPPVLLALRERKKFCGLRERIVMIKPDFDRDGIQLYRGDCLEVMAALPDGAVDMCLTDPPYGTTACKWDSVIPLEPMWEQLKRVIKPRGAIVLTASQPFTSKLIMSNLKMFKYEWIWEKTKSGNFVHAKNMTLKLHENIVVFSLANITHTGQENRMSYNPQGVIQVKKEWKRPQKYESEHRYKRPSHSLNRKITQEGYPSSVISIGSAHNPSHPTQKPVDLMTYLIKTYTTEGETVLDFTMGSGTTGIACRRTGRRFIGIELDDEYYEIARKRIANELLQPNLFDPKCNHEGMKV